MAAGAGSEAPLAASLGDPLADARIIFAPRGVLPAATVARRGLIEHCGVAPDHLAQPRPDWLTSCRRCDGSSTAPEISSIRSWIPRTESRIASIDVPDPDRVRRMAGRGRDIGIGVRDRAVQREPGRRPHQGPVIGALRYHLIREGQTKTSSGFGNDGFARAIVRRRSR